MNAGGNKGKALQQPFNVRIIRCFRRQAQPSGNLRMPLGELTRQFAQIRKLAIVVSVQFVKHAAAIIR